MNPQAIDVPSQAIVIGGGIIGLALARDLAGLGTMVQVLEANRCGAGATRAAAGMLSPVGEDLDPPPFLALGERSLALFPAFVAELEDETGADVGYHPSGKLEIAFTEAEADHLEDLVRRHGESGKDVEFLDGNQVAERLPSVRGRATAGAWIPGDHVVDNRLMAAALRRACDLRGVEILEGVRVDRVDSTAGQVTGVTADDGRSLTAPRVILAAGAWGAALNGLPRQLPVRPIRGQMLSIEGAPPHAEVIATARAYLVPRWDHLIVGATSEDVGFQEGLTPAGQASLLNGLLEVYPELGSRPIREQWIGFRPATPDGLPILGEDPELGGLIYATGHFRNGILLTPITVEALRPGGGPESANRALAPFSPTRFSEQGAGGNRDLDLILKLDP